MRVFCFRHVDHGVSHPEARDALFERLALDSTYTSTPLGPAVKVHMLLTTPAVREAASYLMHTLKVSTIVVGIDGVDGYGDLVKGAANNAKLSLGEFVDRRTPDPAFKGKLSPHVTRGTL